MKAFMQQIDEAKKNPDSKYDGLIYKQNCVNDTVAAQVKFVWLCTALTRIDFLLCNLQLNEAKDKLAVLTHSLKSIQVCGKGKHETIGSWIYAKLSVFNFTSEHNFADCQLNSKDLILNYDCMSKVSKQQIIINSIQLSVVLWKFQNELLKEVKRFERMQIDLKSNLDRMQYKIDHESKVRKINVKFSVLDNAIVFPFKDYYNLADQFQKLQIELYYLQNLNDKHSMKAGW